MFELQTVAVGFHDIHKLIYGFPKTGKTTLASHLEKDGKPPAFVMTEDGHKALGIHAERVRSWEEFALVKAEVVAKAKEFRATHSGLVLDLVKEIEEFAVSYIQRQFRVQHISEIPHGKGYALARDLFRGAVKDLQNVTPVTFLAHAKEREIDHQGETLTMLAPDLTPSGLEFVAAKSDAIAYIVPGTRSQPPRLTFRPTARLMAGSRFRSLTKEDFVFDPANPAQAVADMARAMA